MEFEWDELKAMRNSEKHGISFEVVPALFADSNYIIIEDDRFSYGETRYLAIGKIDERICTVVYTTRDQNIRLISACKANKKERYYYEHH